MMQLLLSVAGFAVLIITVLFGVAIRNLIGSRLKRPSIELRPCEGLPPFLEELFRPAAEKLRQMGFEQLHCIYRESFISHSLAGKWAVVFGNRTESAYAEISFNSNQTEMPGYEIFFTTIYSDDTMLETVNCRKYGIVVEIPQVIFVDPYALTMEEQWKAHCEKAKELVRTKKAFPLASILYVARHEIAGNQHIDRLVAEGIVKESNKGEYAFRFLRSIPIAGRMLMGMLKSTRIHQARKKKDPIMQHVMPLEADVEAYQRIESVNRKRPIGRAGKTVLLLVSAMLFSLSFGITLSPRTVLFLLGAVLFHELGHFLGMYIFGYRNLQILFVPFLGAVAYGKEENTKPFQRVIVLLLGPLPGIVVGLTGMVLSTRFQAQWLSELSTLMLVLNFFNLIPMMPLDGGQLVRTLLFQRFPRIQAVFFAVSAILLMLWSATSKDSFFSIIGMVMFMSVPLQWRQGGALLRMKKERRELVTDERARLSGFFKILREKPFSGIPFAKKVEIVKLAERELKMAPASWRLITASLFIYIITVCSPLFVFIAGVRMTQSAINSSVSSSATAPEWDDRIAKAATSDERWSLLLQAGDWYRDFGDSDGAKKYYEKALELSRTFGDTDLRLAKSDIALASLQEGNEARQLYEHALSLQEKQTSPDSQEIAETLQLIANTQDAADSIPTLERRMAVLEKIGGESSVEMAYALRGLALTYEIVGEDAKAEKAILRSLTISKQLDGQDGHFSVLKDCAIYYAMKGRFEEAERLLNDGLRPDVSAAVNDGNWAFGVHEELGWVKLSQGKGDEAIAHLKAALESNRASIKNNMSYKKLGILNYFLMKVVSFARGPQASSLFSDETGESIRDLPLLLDISYACLTSKRPEEARHYADEARGLINKYGMGARHLPDVEPSVLDPSEDRKLNFLDAWTKKKMSAREKVKSRL